MKAIILLLGMLVTLAATAQKPQEPAEVIDALLDSWHKAAGDNDQETYFSVIDEEGIYIGTDSSELWTKQQFYDWSTPYFNDRKGWSFTKNRLAGWHSAW